MKTLDEIKKVVMDNAKKGKLTTTKYVGPYQYKSGYDNYFALSFDKEGDVIVYSLFKNDRGEHIDTDTVKLSDLDEKVLNEVCENVNTKDQDILDILDWYEKWEPSLYEHNTDILVYLGIIKPEENSTKQKEIFVLDEKNIPNLENEKDAYFITRSHKVGVLKCTGEVPEELSRSYSCFYNNKRINERIYEAIDPDDSRRILTSNNSYADKKFFGFGRLEKKVKNKGCFAVIDKGKKSDYQFIFVRTKNDLIELFNNANKIVEEKDKYYYIINTDYINCFKSKDAKRFTEKNFIVLSDKDEALKKFEKLKKELYKKLDDYLEKAAKLLSIRTELLGENTEEKYFYVEVYKLKIGDKFVARENFKEIFTIANSYKNRTVYLEGGWVVHPYLFVLPYDKLEDVKIEHEYSKLRKNIRDINDFIETIKSVKERLNKYTPIIDEGYVFSVNHMKNRYKELIKIDFNINKA